MYLMKYISIHYLLKVTSASSIILTFQASDKPLQHHDIDQRPFVPSRPLQEWHRLQYTTEQLHQVLHLLKHYNINNLLIRYDTVFQSQAKGESVRHIEGIYSQNIQKTVRSVKTSPSLTEFLIEREQKGIGKVRHGIQTDVKHKAGSLALQYCASDYPPFPFPCFTNMQRCIKFDF